MYDMQIGREICRACRLIAVAATVMNSRRSAVVSPLTCYKSTPRRASSIGGNDGGWGTMHSGPRTSDPFRQRRVRHDQRCEMHAINSAADEA